MTAPIFKTTYLTAMMIGSLHSGLAVAAQPAQDPLPAIEEEESSASDDSVIVVTATKSGQSLQDIAGAATVLSADEIGAGRTENAGDLASSVPNVSVGDQFGVSRAFIRGIGLTSIDLGADGAVAFLQNGAMISRPAAQLSGFYDVQQIEVLRGPQGTIYGRGATAGVINIVTAQPTADLGGYARLTFGNYQSRTFESAMGGPVTGDNFLIRVAGKYEKHDGFGRNLFTQNGVDDRDAYAVRGSALAKITPELKILIVADHFRENDHNYAFHYFGPTITAEDNLASSLLGGSTIFDYYRALGQKPNLRNIYSDQDAINKRKGSSIQAVTTWSADDFSLVLTTAYRKFKRFNRDDLDASEIDAFGRNDYTENSRSFSQEFNTTYARGGLSILAGASYFEEKLFGEVRVPTTNLASYFNIILGTNLPADFFDDGNYLQRGTVKTQAAGAYLEGSYEILPNLKLTAGARYNWEKRRGVGRFTSDAQGIDVPTDKEGVWNAVTPKFAIEYRTPGGTLLYGKATRGFKSGVVNIGSANAVINPEYIWSYEAGVRGETADHSFGFGAAAFYYDYKNLQVGFVNANSIVETINAAAARNYGVEVEATLRPARHTAIRLFGTYLNAKYTDFCTHYYAAGDPARPQPPSCPADPTLSDLSGNRLANAPKFTAAAFVDQHVDLGNSGALDLSADIHLQDEIFFTEFNNRDARQEPSTLINARIVYHFPDEKTSLALWGKNLTNKYMQANTIIAAPLYGSVSVGTLRPPRTYGLTFGLDF
jgi:iron complex outermembrane receptor protein